MTITISFMPTTRNPIPHFSIEMRNASGEFMERLDCDDRKSIPQVYRALAPYLQEIRKEGGR